MPSSAATGRESEKFNLRLPDGMRDRIAEAAKVNNRSMNAEIVARLTASFEDSDLDERMTRIEESLAQLHSRLEEDAN